MFTTNNQDNSAKLISLLNARLADAIDLLYQAKQAHWNVTGPAFYALHELFEKIGDGLRDHVDDIAERVAQLGGEAEGTIRMVAERSSLPEYPRQLSGGAPHLDALAGALSATAMSMREAIGQSSSLGDEVTADIFVGVTRTVDKLLWMVQAHGQPQDTAQPKHAPAERKPETSARPRH